VAVLDNPALAEMVGHKQPDSLRRTMLDFVFFCFCFCF
jgi:hypothetical protein